MGHKFNPEQMERLISSERRRLLEPEAVLREMGLAPGQVLVDVGAGPGFSALPAAAVVGPTGHVYAVDTAPAMLERLAERRPEGLNHLSCVLSRETAVPLPDAVAQHVLVMMVLHEIAPPDRAAFLGEMKRLLAPGGKLAVVDWHARPSPMGPPLAERLAVEQAVDLLKEHGWRLEKTAAAGAYAYLLQASPAG